MLCVQGVANVQSQTPVPGGVPSADGRARASWSLTNGAIARVQRHHAVHHQRVGQTAFYSGKLLPGKEGLTSAEREEFVRLRRQLRQVQQEHDILAKATAWFAGRSDATSTKSSDS